jgi:large conductance mechanosensitive channel
MGMISEFKAFAMKGNLVDTAVAFVMGAAFGKVVSAFIDGMVMPLIGMLTGGVDFNDKKYILQQGVAAVKEGDKIVTPEITEVSLKYVTFITNIIDFIVVAVVIFMVIKAMNNAKKKEAEAPAAPAPTPANEVLLAEIRDLLKK